MQGRRGFLVFQGGGARGIVHIGGLDAVEAQGIQIVGAAGTSAGALIAAFVAAGYRAHDLLDTSHLKNAYVADGEPVWVDVAAALRDSTQRPNLLGSVAGGKYKWPADLFTRWGWMKLMTLASIPSVLKHWPTRILAASLYAWWATSPSLVVPWIKLIAPVVAALFYWLVREQLRGLTSLRPIRTVVDEAMRMSPDLQARHIPQLPPGVTFRQLREAGCLPLKVVATNVSEQNMTVFSWATTPRIAVADAVCASISLPVIFRPHSIPMGTTNSPSVFMDGGILSNLPAWAFDEERHLDPDAWTIAFSLKELRRRQRPAGHKAKRLSWGKALVNAVVNGTPELHTRGVAKLVQIPLYTSLTLLDFKERQRRYIYEVSKASARASKALEAQATALQSITDLLLLLGRSLEDSLRFLQGPFVGSAVAATVQLELAIALRRSNEGLIAWVPFRFNGGLLPHQTRPFVYEHSILESTWRRQKAQVASPAGAANLSGMPQRKTAVAVPLRYERLLTATRPLSPVALLVTTDDIDMAALALAVDPQNPQAGIDKILDVFYRVTKHYDLLSLGRICRDTQVWP